MVELVDTLALGASAARHEGSSPFIPTIFSFAANEEDKDANGLLDEDVQLNLFNQVNQHSRDKLESYIADYNATHGTNYTTKDSCSFYNYYRDIADRVKKREIDLLLVVNTFLTGFDSKLLNTLYVPRVEDVAAKRTSVSV